MKLRWRLFAKYAVLIAALVSLTLIASGITSIWFSYEENQRQLVALQREKAIGAAARIEQYVKNIEHQLGWVTLSQTGTDADRNLQRRDRDAPPQGGWRAREVHLSHASYRATNGIRGHSFRRVGLSA